jgi:hypothetical protein
VFGLILKVRHGQGIHRAAQRGVLHRRYPSFPGFGGLRIPEGRPPKGIAASFPPWGLNRFSEPSPFYMANREVVDRYLSDGEREFEAMRQQARRDHPTLYAKLAEVRRRTHSPTA